MNKDIANFKQKIKYRRLSIAVVGLGYVGLPLACEFAGKGFSVLGIDLDEDRLRNLSLKKSYITDISSRRLSEVIRRGRFRVSNDFRLAKQADVVFVCVPTPLKRKFQPNISYIVSAVKLLAKNINPGTLVILESTTYPGTTHEVILPLFQQQGFNPPRGIYLCFSPERIDPGNKNYPLAKIPKIVGGINRDSTELARLTYEVILKHVHCLSSARAAETAKLLENTFRLVNIGLIDELAMMAHKMDIDIWEVIQAASTKPFGFLPFYPSAGVGGHCIPKDPLYLYWKARHFGFRSRFIKLASNITSFMPAYVVNRLEEILAADKKSLARARILIVGVTYKRDVKDLRKSPALDVIEALQKRNIKPAYYDPIIPYLKINRINLKSISLDKTNLAKFDCAVVITAHSKIDYRFLLKNSPLIFDTCNAYSGIKHKKIVRL